LVCSQLERRVRPSSSNTPIIRNPSKLVAQKSALKLMKVSEARETLQSPSLLSVSVRNFDLCGK
jgi:hypothetical protein